MDNFEFVRTKLAGPVLIQPFYIADNRGSLLKDFEQTMYEKNGLQFAMSETFESLSSKGTIRGLHFQINSPQAKLVRVIQGEIFDVIVDLRKESVTFGKWESFQLSDRNHSILFVPRGFAHGFQVLSENALVSYKCDGIYDKDTDTGIRWNDAQVAIGWIGQGPFVISERDQSLMSLVEFRLRFKGI